MIEPCSTLFVWKFFTVVLGVAAVTMSSMLGIHFIRATRPIGKAVGLMLFGEAVGGFLTVLFAVTTDGILDIGTPVTSIAMRWAIFLTAMTTSIHLAYQTWKIEVYGDERE
jgi:hypothetical protein